MKRFWDKVSKGAPDECWEWTASRTLVGYGVISRNGRNQGAHRVSWELANGKIPDGMQVCHRCDNRGCVNPSHLFLGTAKENIRDMWDKGRAHRPPQMFDRGEALEMRLSGRTTREIAAHFGVSQPSVSVGLREYVDSLRRTILTLR